MEPEGSNADYEIEWRREHISICVYVGGSMSTVRVPIVTTREEKREIAFLDTWVMTRLEPREQRWEKNKRQDALLYLHIGRGDFNGTKHTKNAKGQRRGRGKREKRENSR